MTLKTEDKSPSSSDDDVIKTDTTNELTNEKSKRSETPPLKRLMRQDPLPLFMRDKGPSPPKKIFREEIYSKHHNVPFLSSPHSSLLKHIPTHPKQAMLKAKHYSNKLLTPFIPFNIPKVVIDDQPLDLSKKSSSKSIPEFPKKDLPPDTKKSPGKYTNGFLSNVGHSHSSLQSLQKRFGGDIPTKTHRHPMSGMLLNVPPTYMSHNAMHLPHPVLNSTQTDGCRKISKSQSSPSQSTSKLEKKPEKGESSESKRKSPHNTTDLNSNVTSKSEDSKSTYPKEENSKYTIHKCSCQKTYNTLYGLSLHLQETGHLPAGTKQASLMEYPKLVRGQDMWLNQESEQTKRILRCIQCGESFKSLPMLTVHMMQTQHYTKIVSSEHGRRAHKCSAYCDRDLDRECIFKCKVCNGTFSDMEGLANHMILSGHHKKNLLKHNYMAINLKGKRKRFSSGEDSIDTTGSSTIASIFEYKRKCLRDSASPISNGHSRMSDSPNSDLQEDSRITCENCGERIETGHFVDHVRECLLQSRYESPFTRLKIKKEIDDVTDDAKSNDDVSDKFLTSDEDERTERKPLKLQLKLEKIEKGEKDRDIKSENGDESEKSLSIDATSERGKDETKVDSIKTESKLDDDDDDESQNLETHDIDGRKFESKVIAKAEVSARKHLDIIDPDTAEEQNVDGNSALQAMESFIQRSFSSKFNYRRNSGRFFTQDHSHKDHVTHFKEKTQQKRSPVSMLEKYQKYFGDIYKQDVESICTNNAKSRDSGSPIKDELEKLEKMCEKVKRSNTPEKSRERPDPDATERPESGRSDVSGENLSSKYLSVDDGKESSVENEKSSSSALDSLSSFVYGQPLTSEHPLDSLQKLLTKSSIPAMSPSHSAVVKPILRPVTPDVPFPLNLSLKREPDDDENSLEKENFSDQDSNHSGSESDANSEYRCAACSRHFASKGSYRYHLSRCHLSSVKKYGIKEAFNMSPYIYLPLDHTAKFSKYYEMAQELANKGK
ncbi:hypothetical protein FSP39_000371 [Pinctada imbricata]|uniref:C2H2-type domain-containing protein n=1 Tax=Pinctada imbricata TaxID=66713 RepID=A0AA88XGY3_PINIB|nr:hypothetical protein FSP39_000371 [Pinctada imbricata]